MRHQIDALKATLAGRYAIQRELGQGGMATVYYASDLRHDRAVALKVLLPDLARAVGPERFLREIRITAGLSHPHILPLLDSGEAGEFLFYVMPFVAGESLRARLDREKQLPLDDALQVAREVADALSFAHSQGVIHRDIKPDNILFQAGHAVVADFGIARAISAAGGRQITETGLAIGTPSYMSPEQASGSAELDGRSDLYALACVVYEMLAGRPPFTGATVESVIHQHLAADPPPITQFRPAVPPAVSGALARALSKAPADRFSPVAQFSDALRGPAPATLHAAGPGKAKRWSTARMATLGAGVLAMVAIVVAANKFLGAGDGTDAAPSVAVLPFTDLSGGASEYLGDGIAETLINALSGVEGLRVAARTSAFSFKGRNEDVRTIADQLNVTAVLEGSVQQAGNRLRITAQLINAEDGFHLWSSNFDRDVGDVFAVQDEVARAVVSALQVKLLGDRGAPIVEQGTRDIAAYNAYLQGRFFWNKRTADDLVRAAAFFDQAIAADSNFARAWAGLADSYVLYGPSEYDVQGLAWSEAQVRGERAARRALALDSTLAEAHTALAALLDRRYAWEEAGRAYERALELDPRYPTGRQWYGGYLAGAGRAEEGLAQLLRAAELDPLSLVIACEVAELYDVLGRTAEARAQYERLLQLYPDAPLVHFFAGLHLLIAQDFERAAGLIGQWVTSWWGDAAEGARIATLLGNGSTRNATLRAMADTSRRLDVTVAAYRTLGENQNAIAAVERAVDGPYAEYIYLPHVLASLGPPLNSDPRVRAAIQRLGR